MLLESRILSLRWIGEVQYMAPKPTWKSDAPERGVNDRPAAQSSFSHVRLTQVYARMAVPSCWETCPSSQTRTDVRLSGKEC